VVILLLGVYLAWQGSVTLGSLVFAVTLSEKANFPFTANCLTCKEPAIWIKSHIIPAKKYRS
jgi:hypothetical protein